MEQQKTVRLFSLSTCPACKNARKFLDEKGIKYECVEVDLLEGSEQWAVSNEIKKHNPAVTFPTIVIEETIIGYDLANLKKAFDIE